MEQEQNHCRARPSHHKRGIISDADHESKLSSQERQDKKERVAYHLSQEGGVVEVQRRAMLDFVEIPSGNHLSVSPPTYSQALLCLHRSHNRHQRAQAETHWGTSFHSISCFHQYTLST